MGRAVFGDSKEKVKYGIMQINICFHISKTATMSRTHKEKFENIFVRIGRIPLLCILGV